MAWYMAPCLEQLRGEINTYWPGRDRASDGGIGDASHQAAKSDHNPDYSAGGVVRARDFDEDGIPTNILLREFITDSRTEYVIYEGYIYQRKYGFAPRKYYGKNPHDKHIHLSIRHGKQWENDRRPWLTDATLVGNTDYFPNINLPNVGKNLPKLLEENMPLNGNDLDAIHGVILRLWREPEIEQRIAHAATTGVWSHQFERGGVGPAAAEHWLGDTRVLVGALTTALANATPGDVDEVALATALAPLLSTPETRDATLDNLSAETLAAIGDAVATRLAARLSD